MANRNPNLASRDTALIWRKPDLLALIKELEADDWLSKDDGDFLRTVCAESRDSLSPPTQNDTFVEMMESDSSHNYERLKRILFGLERKLDPAFDPWAEEGG